MVAPQDVTLVDGVSDPASGDEYQGISFGGGDASESRQQPFLIEGSVARFAPQLFPETIRVRKQRELNRTQGFCKGEDVVDEGTKNREVHVTGRLRGFEIEAFHDLLDAGEPMELTSSTWSGEVYVKEGEVEGPDGYFPRDNELYWTYTLDLVSTGLDEPQDSGNGVVSGLENLNPYADVDVTDPEELQDEIGSVLGEPLNTLDESSGGL